MIPDLAAATLIIANATASVWQPVQSEPKVCAVHRAEARSASKPKRCAATRIANSAHSNVRSIALTGVGRQPGLSLGRGCAWRCHATLGAERSHRAALATSCLALLLAHPPSLPASEPRQPLSPSPALFPAPALPSPSLPLLSSSPCLLASALGFDQNCFLTSRVTSCGACCPTAVPKQRSTGISIPDLTG